jgi:hypothetical protein
MSLRCSGLTKKGSKCRRTSSCRWHKQEMCPVCLDEIQFKQLHKTTCGHVFHSECILTWFISSDECPVCRHEESTEPVIIFKHSVHERMAQNYMDTIRSLEDDVTRYRRRIRALRDR